MSTQGFLGTWVFESSDNYEDYLKAVGVGFAARKIHMAFNPTYQISKQAGVWTIRTETTLSTNEVKFVEGVELEEDTVFNSHTKSTYMFEGPTKLVCLHKDPDNGQLIAKVTREVRNKKLVMVICLILSVSSTFTLNLIAYYLIKLDLRS